MIEGFREVKESHQAALWLGGLEVVTDGLLLTVHEQGRVESQSGDQLRQIVSQSVPQDNGRLLQ